MPRLTYEESVLAAMPRCLAARCCESLVVMIRSCFESAPDGGEVKTTARVGFSQTCFPKNEASGYEIIGPFGLHESGLVAPYAAFSARRTLSFEGQGLRRRRSWRLIRRALRVASSASIRSFARS